MHKATSPGEYMLHDLEGNKIRLKYSHGPFQLTVRFRCFAKCLRHFANTHNVILSPSRNKTHAANIPIIANNNSKPCIGEGV